MADEYLDPWGGGFGDGGSSAGSNWSPFTPSTPSTPSSPFSTVAEAYHSDVPTWQDIAGEGDLDIDIPEEYHSRLWEYDPAEEEAIKAGAYGDIDRLYAGAIPELQKIRQKPTTFASTGDTLLDMTAGDLYGGVEKGARGTILDMMTGVTGKRREHRDDIIQRLMDIQTMRGEEFEEVDRDAPEGGIVGTVRQKPGGGFTDLQLWNGERWVDFG